MKRTICKFGFIAVLALTALTQPSYAAITTTGDVDPADPATWTSSTHGFIGKTGSGTMNITDGSDVLDNCGYIGYYSGSTCPSPRPAFQCLATRG